MAERGAVRGRQPRACGWSRTTARSTTATTTCSPTRRCGSSTTTCGGSMAPSVDRNIRLAWDAGYLPVNERFADAVAESCAAPRPPLGDGARLPAVLVPRSCASACPDAVLQHFTHIPWPQPDYWRVLPADIRTAIHESLLACDIVGLHTERYVRAFLHCVSESPRARSTRAATVHSAAARCACGPTRSRSIRRSSSGWRRGGDAEEPRGAGGAARAADPAGRPYRPVQEHRARIPGLRPVPGRPPRVARAG